MFLHIVYVCFYSCCMQCICVCVAACRLVAQELLLAVFKALLNLTHDSEFGSHRVGEQQGVMEALLDTIFKVR